LSKLISLLLRSGAGQLLDQPSRRAIRGDEKASQDDRFEGAVEQYINDLLSWFLLESSTLPTGSWRAQRE